MRAMILDRYGAIDDLRAGELPDPVPGPLDVLVRVRGAAINPADVKVITGEAKILHARRFPMVVGYDFAGEVERAEPATGFRSGESVYGFLPYNGSNTQGSFAELVSVPASTIAPMPKRASFVEAASCATSAVTALQGMRAQLERGAGQRVLVHGASGGVGSYAVQLARIYDAHVTGTCSKANLDYVRELGAHDVVDYRETELSALAPPFDLIVDVVSNTSFGRIRSILRPGGLYVTLLPSAGLLTGFVASLFTSKRCRMVIVKPKREDLARVKEYIDAGRMRTPVAETAPLAGLVAALHRFQAASVRGKFAIEV